MKNIIKINPKLLVFNDYNANHVDSINMEKLKKSISHLGFNSAVIVRELENGKLEVLGGQHRTMAAIELGMSEIPAVNVGKIDDETAKKITLADNSRYGVDDSAQLSEIIKSLSGEDITTFLPLSNDDLQLTMKAVQIDFENLDFDNGSNDIQDEDLKILDKPKKTHEIVSFKLSLRDAEKIRLLIEKTIQEQSLDNGEEEKIIAGLALAHLMLGE